MGGENWVELMYGINSAYEEVELVDIFGEDYEEVIEREGMSIVYKSNREGDMYIGMIADSCNKKIEAKMKKVCEKYGLRDPTYYAGLLGEVEFTIY